MGTYDDIIKQIDAFIRKYYKNLMIKGFFLFVIIFLLTFLLVSALEYIGHFNSFVRGFLFFLFLGLNLYVLTRYFIFPLSKLYAFGKRLSREQAAQIIGDFFPNVNDKLLNTIQLKHAHTAYAGNVELLQASIEQNARDLNRFTFVSAIDYSKNKRFLKFFLPTVFLVVLVGVLVPEFFKQGSERIFNYSQVYAVEPDFIFEVLNPSLDIEEGSAIKLEVKVIPKPGKAIPSAIFLEYNGGTFLMEKSTKNTAHYTIKNLHKDFYFHFKAQDNQSSSFEVNVIPRTSLGQLTADLSFPSYLGMKDKKITNPGDLVVPEGTVVTWNGVSKHTSQLIISTKDTAHTFSSSGFRFQQQFFSPSPLLFILSNKVTNNQDTNRFNIEVVKDQYPTILVNKKEDSIQTNLVHFRGQVKDDYGLTSVTFYYEIKHKGAGKVKKTIAVPGIIGNSSSFSMTFNLNDLPMELNDRLTYFFTVYDNDGIHGPKATKSQIFQHISPNLNTLNKQRNSDKSAAKSSLNNIIREAENLNERLNSFKNKLAESKDITWQQQQMAKSLQKQQNELKNKINSLKNKIKNSFDKKNKFSPVSEKLKEQQKTLQKLLDKLMDEELKNLLEKLQQKLDKNQSQDLINMLKEGEIESKQIENQLKRTMEMFKRFDVQERAEDIQKSLQNLARKQDSLRNSISDKNANEEATRKQNKLNNEYKELQNQLDSLLAKNSELENPLTLNGLDSLSQDVEKSMENAAQSLKNGQSKPAGESQKNAADKMKQMASQLQAQMKKSAKQKQAEDLKSMQQIEANLLRLSFNQEKVMDGFSATESYNPKYLDLGGEQQQVLHNFKPVADSLRALADRVPKIASFIEQELSEIQKQFRYIPDLIDERKRYDLNVKQHFVMTHFNNLALFINESIQQAQKKMSGSGKKGGSCKTPGGNGKSGSKGMAQSLEQLKQMIKQQLKGLGKGPNPGGTKPGNQPGKKSGGKGGNMLLPMNARKASQMAAQLSQMQEMIRKMQQQLQQQGQGSGLNKLLKEIKDQKKDLINRDWDNDLIQRQRLILTRMLQSEKAIKERGFEKKRESRTGKDQELSNQIQFLEYNMQKEKQIELLKTLDPAFSRYYQLKANQFFQQLNN